MPRSPRARGAPAANARRRNGRARSALRQACRRSAAGRRGGGSGWNRSEGGRGAEARPRADFRARGRGMRKSALDRDAALRVPLGVMHKPLVIVESPAKAKTIAKFLGKNYV